MTAAVCPDCRRQHPGWDGAYCFECGAHRRYLRRQRQWRGRMLRRCAWGGLLAVLACAYLYLLYHPIVWR